MVSPIDAFANLAAANNTPRAALRPTDSSARALDDPTPGIDGPPRVNDPAPTDLSADGSTVNRFNQAVEPAAGVRDGATSAEFARPAENAADRVTPADASGLAAVTAEARGSRVNIAV